MVSKSGRGRGLENTEGPWRSSALFSAVAEDRSELQRSWVPPTRTWKDHERGETGGVEQMQPQAPTSGWSPKAGLRGEPQGDSRTKPCSGRDRTDREGFLGCKGEVELDRTGVQGEAKEQ